MVPAKGLGWPDQPEARTPESAGLHRGHAEPEGPELSDGPRAGEFSTLYELNGLGWPQNMPNDPVLAPQPPARADPPGGPGAAGPGDFPAGTSAGTGADVSGRADGPSRDTRGANGASGPAQQSPARVQQALSAAVSRETTALMAGGVSASAAAGNGREDAMQGGTAAQDDGKAGRVVIPEVPHNPRDTPIARAAEAAVGVRGTGDNRLWPRPGRCRIMTIANQKGGVARPPPR